MRQIFQLVLAMAILAPMLAGPVRAQGNAVYLATYIDVLPNAVVSGVALLKRYRDASRKERGNLRFDVLHEIARPDRFAILEVWQDKAALDGHDKAVSTLRFRDELKESSECTLRRAGATSLPTTWMIAWRCSRL
jgi:quinol monooxygenase YgiN